MIRLAALAVTALSLATGEAFAAPAPSGVAPPPSAALPAVSPQPSAAAVPVDVRTTSGSVTVRLTAPASQVEAGQPLAMELAIESSGGDSFEVPQVGASIGPFDVLSSTRETSQASGTRRATLRFTVLTLESGEVQLPAIPVAVTRADGTRTTVDAGPVTLTVLSLMSGEFDPTAIRDIKGPVAIDAGWAWWWIVAGCAAGAMAALAAFTLWRRRARRIVPPLPAHEWALSALDALERDGLPASGQTHAYWVRLSDIVREYMERRFDIHAPDRTTAEFLAEAGAHAALSEDHRRLLAQFLRTADMVKFAGVRPTARDCASALDTARIFVRQTVPHENPEHAPPREHQPDALPQGGLR